MNWLMHLFGRRPTRARQYRVARTAFGWEAQMSYNAGTVDGLFWYPLNEKGYWLEPDAFTLGRVTKHLNLTKAAAKRAMLRAMSIERDNITEVAEPTGGSGHLKIKQQGY